MKERILKGVNCIKGKEFRKLDEALDFYNYEEILSAWMCYERMHGAALDCETVMEAFRTFYHMVPKTDIGR